MTDQDQYGRLKPPGSCTKGYCRRPRAESDGRTRDQKRETAATLCQYHLDLQARAQARYVERKKMFSADYKHRITKDGAEIPDEWDGVNMHFIIHALDPKTYEPYEADGYILTRENEDGSLYAFRVKAGKNGGTWAWIDRWSHQVTKRLRKGESLVEICKEEMHQQYEPSGGTNVQGIARCDSPTDLVCKWLLKKYAPEEWAKYSKAVTP